MRVCVAGSAVKTKLDAMRAESVPRSPMGYESEALCKFQQRAARLGFIEAEIVKTNYGYSVRYASGLLNFGLIYSARKRDVDGSYACAVAKAQAWQARDPENRFVTAFPGDDA